MVSQQRPRVPARFEPGGWCILPEKEIQNKKPPPCQKRTRAIKQTFRNKIAFRNFIPSLALAAMALAPVSASAGTTTMSVTYYTIAENDQDTTILAAGPFSNEVQRTLGPHGLPVLNTTMYGCT